MSEESSDNGAKGNGLGNQSVEFFLSAEGRDVRVVHARPDACLADVLREHGVDVTGEVAAFVGDDPDDTAGEEPDDSEFAPVDIGERLLALGVRRHTHVTCHRCRAIAVSVNYNQKEARRRFRPAATVAQVLAWAKHRLHLTGEDAKDLVLMLCDTDSQPRPEQRLAELVRGSCKLCFNLVAKELVNGSSFGRGIDGRSQPSLLEVPPCRWPVRGRSIAWEVGNDRRSR